MRKTFIVALTLASFGTVLGLQEASAVECRAIYNECLTTARFPDDPVTARGMLQRKTLCQRQETACKWNQQEAIDKAAKQQKQDYLNALHGTGAAAATTAGGPHTTTGGNNVSILQTGRKQILPK